MRYIIVPLLLVLVLGGLFPHPVVSSENALTATKQVLNQYCFDCHGESGAEANVNLEAMVAAPEFSQRFKSWELVVEMIRENVCLHKTCRNRLTQNVYARSMRSRQRWLASLAVMQEIRSRENAKAYQCGI